MKSLNVLCTFLTFLVVVYCRPSTYPLETSISQPKPGSPLDEVVVESSLIIKNKNNQVRRTRDALVLVPQEPRGLRVKRQHRRRRPQYDQSSANADANSQYFGPDGFGAAAANGQAQGFHTQGALGGFGANAANTQTQSFSVGPNGITGSAGGSTSQVYTLPDGKTINVAFSNGFSTGPDGIANSNANGITIT